MTINLWMIIGYVLCAAITVFFAYLKDDFDEEISIFLGITWPFSLPLLAICYAGMIPIYAARKFKKYRSGKK